MNVPHGSSAAAPMAVQCPFCSVINGIGPRGQPGASSTLMRADLDASFDRERRRNRDEGQALRAPRAAGGMPRGGAARPATSDTDSDEGAGAGAVPAQLNGFPDELVQRLQQFRRMHPAELLLVREVLEQLQAGGQAASTSIGASAGLIDRLTSAWTMDSKTQMTGNCTICLEDFESGQQMRTLPCFHSFHAGCVEEWLEKNRVCPICQFDIVAAANSAEHTLAEDGAAPAT